MQPVTVTLLTFDDAISASSGDSKRHALLGNGFSISYDADVFSYGRLLEEADFSKLSVDARRLFEAIGTTDFEEIINVLRYASTLVKIYRPKKPRLARELAKDADLLKDALAEVLARRHPDNVGSIDSAHYQSARIFLHNFERIYTVNYDLLLYWTSMQDMRPRCPNNDGFGESEEYDDADWVAWKPMSTYDNQRVFYLHGALHLFDAGIELRKITFNRTGIALVDQIREALAQDIYPLVVTEGTSDEKYAKILHAAYLNHALRSFAKIGGTLFIHGLSLAQNDEHILRRLVEGKVTKLYVSVHGDPNTETNRSLIGRAEDLVDRRSSLDRRTPPLSVRFYDADSARVWR